MFESSKPNLFPSRLALSKSDEKSKLKLSGIRLVAGSSGSYPEITSRVLATNFTDFPIGPAVSWVLEIGIIPDLLTRPTVGFIPTMPFIEDGHEIDPLVSVPMAISTIPEATATAEPELDPHGLKLLNK